MTATYTVNCSILLTELPLLDRPLAARNAGFDAVEFWWPFDSPTPPDTDVTAFTRAIQDAGVHLAGERPRRSSSAHGAAPVGTGVCRGNLVHRSAFTFSRLHPSCRPAGTPNAQLLPYLACLPGQVGNVVLCARDPALEGTSGERRHERASTLTRPGPALHWTTVRPWSSTRRVRELVS